MLMDTNDRAVVGEHLEAGIIGQRVEDTFSHITLSPECDPFLDAAPAP
jgi:hypothetical protein